MSNLRFVRLGWIEEGDFWHLVDLDKVVRTSYWPKGEQGELDVHFTNQDRITVLLSSEAAVWFEAKWIQYHEGLGSTQSVVETPPVPQIEKDIPKGYVHNLTAADDWDLTDS